MSVWRAEQMAVDMYSCQHYIVCIFLCRHIPSIRMIVGMIAYAVFFNEYLLIYISIFHHPMTNTKKGSMCMIFPELFQYKRCNLRVRSVIKGQIHSRLGLLYIPDPVGKHGFDPERCACP